jgi:ribonuclease P protein component
LAAGLAYAPGNTPRLSFGQPFFIVYQSKAMSDEAHFSAEQPGPQAAPWLPQPLGDGGRAQDPGGAACPRPQEAQRLIILSKRADFLAANSGRRVPMPGFVLLVRPRKDGNPDKRVGFTVTKRIGNGADHVLIGRSGGVERDFSGMRDELAKALRRAKGAA